MRNQPKPLDRDDAMRAYRMRDILSIFQGGETPVLVTYAKRNGEVSTSTGPVTYFSGADGMDTMSVTIDTTETKGRPSTINLDKIESVTKA